MTTTLPTSTFEILKWSLFGLHKASLLSERREDNFLHSAFPVLPGIA
jgi:hypothetical protein